MLTRQEIYDKVKAHLIAQGCKAVDCTENVCKYRMPDGLKCAAGCLIEDEHYSPTFEGCTVSNFALLAAEGSLLTKCRLLEKALNDSGVSTEDFPLVSNLQVIHDYTDPNEWDQGLKNAASAYGLSP